MSIDIRAIPAAFAATSPVTQNFQWSGSSTTAAPAASTALSQPSADSTVNITSGSGVTSLFAQVQATQDNSNWTTIAQVYITAASLTGSVPVAIPYLGLRVNVVSIAGGSASATLVEGAVPLSTPANGVTIMASPQLTGVPQPGPSLIRIGVPVVLPSTGSVGANGALTLNTALQTTLANCWMYFPAGKAYSGSAAGFYFVQMSSTTAGVVYDNVLVSGIPYIPTSPTPIVDAGPGAFTPTNTIDLVKIPILGGSMGPSGALRYTSSWMMPNNANSKSSAAKLGATTIATYGPASQLYWKWDRILQNIGSASAQFDISASTSLNTDVGASTVTPFFGTINTANEQDFAFNTTLGSTSDYIVLMGATIEVLPGA